ncbi:MAG: cell division protein FtsL, partial [Clostridia bacterium]|nr:cell division protein FtsL [Clostridia bacterium]MBR2013153.1 cell division protein FtsL [Clostridia bacterium]
MKKLDLRNIRWSVVLIAAVFIAIGGYLLYSHIALNEVSSELLAAKQELTKLEGEAGNLQVSIDSKNSMGEIERIATEELGMVKIENYQIQTINLLTDDTVEIIKDEPTNDSWWDGVVAEFNILLEYLS